MHSLGYCEMMLLLSHFLIFWVNFRKKTIKMRIFDVKRNFAKYHTIINIVTKATSNVTGGYKLYVCTINS